MLKLPRLRWLVLGAVVAGAWAMTQEPPKREHWQRLREVEQASPEKPRPVVAVAPAPKPSEIMTASIPRPENPVAPRAEALRTTEKVRLRKEPSTSSAVVAMLNGGQTVEATVSDGKWRKVWVDGKVGWVHGDYLGEAANDSIADVIDADEPIAAALPVPKPSTALTPRPAVVQPAPRSSTAPPETDAADVPRPKEDVAPQEAVADPMPEAIPASAPVDKSLWGAMRPARPPQGGDCQCPYDLMLNGKQCGERSAYARGKDAQCYF